MSPQTRKNVFNLSAFITALIAVAGYALRQSAAAVDSRYVHSDSYTVHLAGEALVHQRDSLIYDARASRQDEKLDLLIRDCQRRGGCQ